MESVVMSLNWITKFNDKELHAPFVIAKDSDYYYNLRKRLTHLVNNMKTAGADDESIRIAKKYADKVCQSIRDYYRGDISSCHQRIENLVKGCDNHKLAVSDLRETSAFPGVKGTEIQFFRARKESSAVTLMPKDMLHIPFSLRGKSGNYRFSIPGVTSLYLANTSYGCWIEMGKPPDHDFYVAPFLVDDDLKIFNLAVATRILIALPERQIDYVHCWVKLLVLVIATSYRILEDNRLFKSEYIISQSIMLACKKLGYDGVAYFSKQVEDEVFALSAINLALFAEYKKGKEYGGVCEHIKVDEPLNYQLFRQLGHSAILGSYEMRINGTGFPTNINGYKRQYNYRETEFYKFDQHLFSRWSDKNQISWGNALKRVDKEIDAKE